MGVCASTPDAKADGKISSALKRDARQQQEETKLLLLGTGESGKSTVFKQMKLLQKDGGGFKPEERENYKRIVHGNCISQMKTLVSAANKLGNPLDKPENGAALMALDGPTAWEESAARRPVGPLIQELWADSGIKKTFLMKDRAFQLDDSAAYLFDNIPRFSQPGYTPSNDDVLRARSRTTGIDEALFHFEGISFRMIDVGGQRAERRKWIHCFDCVTCVVFCIAMSEYDQMLREDGTQPRMKESLLLFEEIVNSPWFIKIPFIIFFNKVDLFDEKITRVPLVNYFPHYAGKTIDDAHRFIADQYLSLSSDKTHKITSHFTIATDPSNMENIFGLVRLELFKGAMTTIGVGGF